MAIRSRRNHRERWVHQFPTSDKEAFLNYDDRTSLVNALRFRDVYRHASLRLLSDLIEVTSESVKRNRPQKSTAPKAGAQKAGAQKPGDRPPEGVPASDGLIKMDYPLIRRAAVSSPCLFRSLQLPRWHRRRFENEGQEAHKILLCQQDGIEAPIDALAHLLAAGIALQFDEAAAAVTFDGKRWTASIWRGTRGHTTRPVASYEDLIAKLRRQVPKPKHRTRFFHIIIAAAGNPLKLPGDFADPPRGLSPQDLFGYDRGGYDRIVYLTEDVPARVPAKLVPLLAKAVLLRTEHGADPGTGPFFCSFIPSIVQTKRFRPTKPFNVALVDEELRTALRERTEPRGWRLQRDRCLVPLDLDAIVRAWAPQGKAKRRSPVGALLRQQEIQRIVYRWARAVTNRQVGVALSGGGASAFRLLPILQRLRAEKVPVDVVSGDSGGALIGAHYCYADREDFQTTIASGWRLQAMIALAFFHSGIVRSVVDRDLPGGRVEHTPIRFIPLATMLPEQKPPEACVVITGTLGEAVQASGAAPMLFAPTAKRIRETMTRFADGGASSLIPARILKDWGADMVFALNCLPGPRRSNPLAQCPGGGWVYRQTGIGRLVDLWVSLGFLTQGIGRETNVDAHVYFEPKPEEIFLVDSALFLMARTFARRSARSKNLKKFIADCVTSWAKFRHWETP